jgi:hypothetical protein
LKLADLRTAVDTCNWRCNDVKQDFWLMQVCPFPLQQEEYTPLQQQGYLSQEYPPQQQRSIDPQQMQSIGYAGSQVQMMQVNNLDINNCESLLVKQIMQDLGCKSHTEFKIAAKMTPTENVLYALEDTSSCLRCLIPTIRPFTINLSKDESPGGDKIASFERHLACPLHPFKICCYQQVDIFKDGVADGSVKEGCYCCVPTFKVFQSDGTHQYDIHQPTCLGGMCVDCGEGLCTFNIYLPEASGDPGSHSGKIVKVDKPLILLTPLWIDLCRLRTCASEG